MVLNKWQQDNLNILLQHIKILDHHTNYYGMLYTNKHNISIRSKYLKYYTNTTHILYMYYKTIKNPYNTIQIL